MTLAAELINGNGISAIALAFFTALLTAGSATIVGIFQIKAKAIEAKNAAQDARVEAKAASENTANVANGFAGRMDRKLDKIADGQNDLARALRDHLEWHVDNPQK